MFEETTKKPDINLPPIQDESYATINSFDKLKKELDFQKKELDFQKKELDLQRKILNWTFGFIVAAFIICFIAFIGFMVDFWKFHGTAYNEHQTIVNRLNNNASISEKINDTPVVNAKTENSLQIKSIPNHEEK